MRLWTKELHVCRGEEGEEREKGRRGRGRRGGGGEGGGREEERHWFSETVCNVENSLKTFLTTVTKNNYFYFLFSC